MNNRVEECMDRIRVLRGVSYGRISREQLREVFLLYSLSAQERDEVYKELGRNGVQLFQEDTNLLEEHNTRSPIVQLRQKRYEEYLAQEYVSCIALFEQDVTFAEKHRETFRQLQDAITERFSKIHTRPSATVRAAIQQITEKPSHDDEESPLLGGRRRIAPTRSKMVGDFFSTWLRRLFTEQEMEELIQQCVYGITVNSKSHRILTVIVYILLHDFYRGDAKRVEDDQVEEDNHGENR